ncbi:MAG TPA: DUF2207 domain-containing protein [Nitriliruptorales bacterium]
MRRAPALGALVVLGIVGLAAGATAQSEPWVIEAYDVVIDVRPDGTMQVAEEIAVDFREQRRGIFREIPVRYDLAYDADIELPDPELEPADYVRVYEIHEIRVFSDTAPDDVLITGPGGDDGWLRIRVGEEDTWITGRHTYLITYVVEGALNGFDAHAELYWNAIGAQWEVPIGHATTTVTGPGLMQATCFQGPQGSDRLCDQAATNSGRITFRAGSLPPYAGMTVVVAFDPAAVDPARPILEERFDLGRRLLGSDAAIPLAILVGLLAIGGVGVLAFRQGRDRETVGGVGVDGTVKESPRRRPLFARLTVPVQFRPPDGLRPAQLGLLVDERVDPVDVTATIVDLAVRGHLRIIEEETKKLLFFSSTDHVLERLPGPPEDELLRYEDKLLDALFEDGDRVELSELRGSFHTEYIKVSNLVYEDGRSRHWFHRSPQKTRNQWGGIGVAAVILSGAITFLLVRYTRVGIVGLPLVLASIVLLALNRWMPHRTAKGSELLVRTLGFKEFIVTAEAGRMDFAEQQHLFLEYLPYAVVFGATDKWAKAFEDLGIDLAEHGFYVSHTGILSLDGLSRSLTSFSSAAGSGLSTSPSSSGSSGFSGGSSGGGGGGGGGGSW